MIIRQLQAENLFKYSRIKLSGLPARGCIGICGANESGKSALVEIITLALFGRTLTLEGEGLRDAVKWGSGEASLKMEFTGQDGRLYTVVRYLDGQGYQRARLARSHAKEPIAMGVDAVDRAMERAIGFTWQQYLDALYLPQKRHLSGQPHTRTIQSLAGVDRLHDAFVMIQQEIDATQPVIASSGEELTTVRRQMQDLHLKPDHLGHLQQLFLRAEGEAAAIEQELEQWRLFDQGLRQAMAEVEQTTSALLQCGPSSPFVLWQESADGLRAALRRLEQLCHECRVEVDERPDRALTHWLVDYTDRFLPLVEGRRQADHHRLHLVRRLEGESGPPTAGEESGLPAIRHALHQQLAHNLNQRRWSALGVLVSGGSTLFSWGIWAALQGTAEGSLLRPGWGWLREHADLWHFFRSDYLPLTAFFCTLLLIGSGVGRWQQNNRRKLLQEQMNEVMQEERIVREQLALLQQAVNSSLAQEVKLLGQFSSLTWSEEIVHWSTGPGVPFLQSAPHHLVMAELKNGLALFQIEMAELLAEVAEMVQLDEHKLEEIGQRRHRLREEIRIETVRREEEERLRHQEQKIIEEIAFQQRNIRVREIGQHLLRNSSTILSGQFNQELRRFLAGLAPRFTDGRYQHLQIDEDMMVQAFSAEKNNFVRMADLSWGTQQQLFLAVRMALAQALVARSIHPPQAMILDEPFAFFDRHRCQQAFDTLLHISNEITQIWIVAQEFPQELNVDFPIVCQREEVILTLTGTKNS